MNRATGQSYAFVKDRKRAGRLVFSFLLPVLKFILCHCIFHRFGTQSLYNQLTHEQNRRLAVAVLATAVLLYISERIQQNNLENILRFTHVSRKRTSARTY